MVGTGAVTGVGVSYCSYSGAGVGSGVSGTGGTSDSGAGVGSDGVNSVGPEGFPSKSRVRGGRRPAGGGLVAKCLSCNVHNMHIAASFPDPP